MDSSKQETIGKKIKKRRHELKLMQEGLARKADVSYTTFVKIESGVVKSPSIQTIMKIADGLEISLDQLIKG